MTLTLHRNDIDSAKQRFLRIETELRKLLGTDVVIEHVGSTALPGVDGKGIVDVMIACQSLKDIKTAVQTLSGSGYFAARDASEHEDRVFMASRLEDTVKDDVHLHIVQVDSIAARQFVAVREYFLSHPLVAKEYSATKHAIAAASRYDREEYKKRKSDFMKKILEKIATDTN